MICDVEVTCIYKENFIRAYVEHPGDYSEKEAYELAKERDEEATIQFLASLDW